MRRTFYEVPRDELYADKSTRDKEHVSRKSKRLRKALESGLRRGLYYMAWHVDGSVRRRRSLGLRELNYKVELMSNVRRSSARPAI